MHENAAATRNRTAEMIRWLASHPRIEQMLCHDEYAIKDDECLELVDALEKQGYYEMIYIFLMKNQFQRAVGNAIDKLVAEMWANEWEKAGNQQMCREIKERIKNEIMQHPANPEKG